MEGISLHEALIGAVEKRHHLYDRYHKNYSNRPYLNKEWHDIGEEIGINGQTARKKWTALRDYFKKVYRQINSSKPGTVTKKWYLYDHMFFLVPHLRDKPSSILPSDGQDEFVEFKDRGDTPSPEPTPSTSSHCSLVGEENLSHFKSSPEQAEYSVIESSRKRRFPRDWNEVMNSSGIDDSDDRVPWSGGTLLDERTLATVSYIGEKLAEKEVPDEDELFCKSLVSKIKSLDPFTKMECQTEMLTLILKFMRQPVQTHNSGGGQSNTS